MKQPPAARAARAAHLHRRMQIEQHYTAKARRELTTGHPATRAIRAAYVCAQYADAIARHEAQAETLAVAA